MNNTAFGSIVLKLFSVHLDTAGILLESEEDESQRNVSTTGQVFERNQKAGFYLFVNCSLMVCYPSS